MKACIALLMLLTLHTAGAKPGLSVETLASSDRLSNGSPDWNSSELHLGYQSADRRRLDGTLRDIHRFGLQDSQIEANLSLPWSPHWGTALTAIVSPTHRVLARTELRLGVYDEFSPAWLAHVYGKSAEYDNSSVVEAGVGLEHYFSAFRIELNLRATRSLAVTAKGIDAQLDYYYNDLSHIGIQQSTGQEAGNINASTVLVTTVQSTALSGQHWLNPHWALRWGGERVRQGDFYVRKGVRLGVQYIF